MSLNLDASEEATRITPIHKQAFPHPWDYHKNRHCIWIVSPQGYVHSQAFEDIADSLHQSFVDLGGTAPITTDARGWNGRIPIVYGANLLPSIANQWLPAGSIIVNMEQIKSEYSWLNRRYIALLKQYAVLDYSCHNQMALSRIGIRADLLQLGYSNNLTRVPHQKEKDIDILFYGSMNERRGRILSELESRGLRVAHLFGVYGKERDKAIGRSKIVLNMHYHEHGVFEICRVSYLLANKVCVVSECSSSDDSEMIYESALHFCDYNNIVESCLSLIRDEEQRNCIAGRGFEFFRSRRQVEMLSELIAGSQPH